MALTLAPASGHAAAQAPELSDARAALGRYDLEGAGTVETLRALGQSATTLRGRPAEEARFLRAEAAADLLLLARSVPSASALGAQIASALGVPEEGVRALVRSELEAMRHGVFRRPAEDTLAAMALEDSVFAGQGGVVWSRVHGPHRDLLFVQQVGEVIARGEAGQGLEAFGFDPCAGGPCPSPVDLAAGPDRARLGALLELGRAGARLAREVEEGNALVVAAQPVVQAALERASGLRFPAPLVAPASFGMAASDAGAAVAPALLVSVGVNAVHIMRPTHLRVEGGSVVADRGDDVMPGFLEVPLPGDFRPVVTAIHPLLDLLRARGLPAGTRVAVGARPEVESHVVARVVASIARAGLAPAMLVRQAADGTLRGVTLALMSQEESEAHGVVTLHVRIGGYALVNAHGGEEVMPRVHGPNGDLVFDVAALAASVPHLGHHALFVDPMASVPAADLLETAFTLGSNGGTISMLAH